MDEESLSIRCESLLKDRLKHLQNQANMNVNARDRITFDQQSVGRSSRMDAMQQQAMAQATANNRKQEIAAIHAALARIAAKEYNYCKKCSEEIPLKRLQIATRATRCLVCPKSYSHFRRRNSQTSIATNPANAIQTIQNAKSYDVPGMPPTLIPNNPVNIPTGNTIADIRVST